VCCIAPALPCIAPALYRALPRQLLFLSYALIHVISTSHPLRITSNAAMTLPCTTNVILNQQRYASSTSLAATLDHFIHVHPNASPTLQN
jgi:hypothetical protein